MFRKGLLGIKTSHKMSLLKNATLFFSLGKGNQGRDITMSNGMELGKEKIHTEYQE